MFARSISIHIGNFPVLPPISSYLPWPANWPNFFPQRQFSFTLANFASGLKMRCATVSQNVSRVSMQPKGAAAIDDKNRDNGRPTDRPPPSPLLFPQSRKRRCRRRRRRHPARNLNCVMVAVSAAAAARETVCATRPPPSVHVRLQSERASERHTP